MYVFEIGFRSAVIIVEGGAMESEGWISWAGKELT